MNPKLLIEIFRIFFLRENIEPEVDYDVDPFVEELKEFQESRKQIFYKIERIVDNGIIVRALGIYGFINYNHAPWKYPRRDYWKIVGPYLMQERFVGIIQNVFTDRSRPFVLFDGKHHQFSAPLVLKKNHVYKAIVLSETANFMRFELGHGFNWDYGSVIEMQHKSNFSEIEHFDSIEVGDEITVIFRGYSFGTALFSDQEVNAGWINGEAESIVGTQQRFNVIRVSGGENEYWLNGHFKGIIPIHNNNFPNHSHLLRDYLARMRTGEEITCQVFKPSSLNQLFILRPVEELLSKLEEERIAHLFHPDSLRPISHGEHKYTIIFMDPTYIIVEKKLQVHIGKKEHIINYFPKKSEPFMANKIMYSNETDPVKIIKSFRMHESYPALAQKKLNGKIKAIKYDNKALNKILNAPNLIMDIALDIKARLPESKLDYSTDRRCTFVINANFMIRLSKKTTFPGEYIQWWTNPIYLSRKCISINIQVHEGKSFLCVDEKYINFADLGIISRQTVVNKVLKILDFIGIFREILPSPEVVAESLAKEERIQIRPAGEYALYKLGIRLQLPVNLVYYTNGPSRELKAGIHTIKFKAAKPKKLSLVGKYTSLIIPALEEVGTVNIDSRTKDRIKRLLLNEEPAHFLKDLSSTSIVIYDYLLTLHNPFE